MRRVLVVLSGIYLIISSLLMIGTTVFSQFLSARGNHLETRYAACFIIVLLWPLITGLGLFFRKNWARISLVTVSSFTLIAGIFWFWKASFSQPAEEGSFEYFTWIVLCFVLIFLIAIPGIFLIFFNRASVKELFVHEIKISK